MKRVLTPALLVCLWPHGFAAEVDPEVRKQVEQLKAVIASQQEQIDRLQKALLEQRRILDQLAPAAQPAAPAENAPAAPLSFPIGAARFTPSGFLDLTSVYRSTNVGSGIGTTFGAIPFNSSVAGHLSENRLSLQNSRLALRVDSTVRGAAVTGYVETDFLGNAPANLAVTTHSDTLRMRLYWVDLRKSKFEILAGQSWSLLTPNRKGLSPVPADIFYTQNMDTNYQAGLIWARDPQLRFILHPSTTVAWGVSLEAPEQYTGPAVTYPGPTALSGALSAQFNNGSSGLSVPNLHPDFVSKIAFDSRTVHLEAAGLFRTFRSFDPITGARHTATGAGGSVNANIELAPGFRLVANTFVSSGGGRYIFGLGPDLVVRPDASISPVRALSTVDGFEYDTRRNVVLYGYYGGAYFARNYAVDPSAAQSSFAGFGFPGSGGTANRAVQETTFGATRTFWTHPTYGGLKLITQYSYLWRNLWSATLSTRDAHTHTVFVDLRYELP